MTNTTEPYQPKPNLIIWRPIAGFPRYRVSDRGEVLDTHRNCKLKQSTLSTGYRVVHLFKDNKKHTNYVHRLVAQAFIPNPDGVKTVDHIDSDKANNTASNLQWLSRVDNINKAHIERGHNVNRWFTGFKDGEIIGRWQCQNEAAHELSLDQGPISSCLSGNKNSIHGYSFRYDD